MDPIWFDHYPDNTPHEINPDAYSSLVEMFEQNCQQFAKRPAASNLGHKLTYQDLDKQSRYFAAFLQQELGLQKGDRVAIMLPNVLQYLVAMFGILRAGCVVVNVNPLYTERELTHQLNDAGAKCILVLANFAHVLAKSLPKTEIEHVLVTQLGDMLGFPKGPIVNFVVKHIKRLVPGYDLPNSITFNDAIAKGKTATLAPVELKNTDLAFLQYTGGTTGVAKGAELTHRNMLANMEQCVSWGVAGNNVVESGEIIVTPLPLYHIFSLTVCCFVFLKVGGQCMLITNPRDIPSFVKELKSTKFTGLVGINTLFNALVHNEDFQNIDFKHLRITISGGMALQKSVADDWQKVTGNCIVEGYGLTETSPVCSVNNLDVTKFTGSIGFPLPSTQVSIRDESGEELGVNEIGELCFKGPQVMRGYWQKPKETEATFTEDGWLKTGDIAKINEQGMVYIVDRKKDMIVVSGFNVYPNEIEEVIASHPGVLEVGVVGVPSEHSGETVKAYVVRRDPQLTEDAIREFCKEQLTGYKRPKIIEFRDELPKTSIGKILRRELRKDEPVTA